MKLEPTYLREMMSRLPRLLSFAQFWHYRPSAVRRMITHIERVWQTTFMDAWLRQPASDMMMFGYPHVINATDGWEDNAPTYRFIDAWDDLQVSLSKLLMLSHVTDYLSGITKPQAYAFTDGLSHTSRGGAHPVTCVTYH